MSINQKLESDGDRSPIPNAIRITYYDDRGEVYYTEWRLAPAAEPNPALPGATLPAATATVDVRRVA